MSDRIEPLAPATAPVLFISGAGLPTWIWDDVRAALPDDVETAVAQRPATTGATLAAYADAAVATVAWPTFVVVAHSAGGAVAAELLARHPDRVTGILGISAAFPRAGRSFVATMPFPARLVLSLVMRLAGTRPPEKLIRAGLTGDLPEATADRIVAEFEQESPRLYRDHTSPRQLPPARAYLHTTEDKELPRAAQRTSAATLDATWADELPTGHLPMLQSPDAVAGAVERLLQDLRVGRTADRCD